MEIITEYSIFQIYKTNRKHYISFKSYTCCLQNYLEKDTRVNHNKTKKETSFGSTP